MCNNSKHFVIASTAMRNVECQVHKVAGRPTTVLLTGETGVGKNRIAKKIHEKSPRSKFLYLNCAATQENIIESTLFGHVKGAFTDATMPRTGYFEDADKGTFFIDEIGDLSLEMQKNFLHVLETGEFTPMGSNRTQKVNVRVIAATNRNLEQLVKDGGFREDLYYRLHISPIHIPPLRCRREEIPALVKTFIDEIDKEFREEDESLKNAEDIDEDALKYLTSERHRWVGNVRELRSKVENAMLWATGDELTRADFHAAVAGSQDLSETLFNRLLSEKGFTRKDIEDAYAEKSGKGKGRGPNDYQEFENTMSALISKKITIAALDAMEKPKEMGYVSASVIRTFAKKFGRKLLGESSGEPYTAVPFIAKLIEIGEQLENKMADDASEGENGNDPL